MFLMSLLVAATTPVSINRPKDISDSDKQSSQSLIHLDKPYYFAGEYIFYVFSNHQIHSDSTIAQVSFALYDQIIDSYFVRMNDQAGHGYLALPHTLVSGIYHLEISVYDQMNTSIISLAKLPVPIYNPEELSKLSEIPQSKMVRPNGLVSEEDRNITLKVEPSFLQPRQKVMCSGEITKADVENIDFFSVCIREKGVYGPNRHTSFNYPTHPLPPTLKKIPVFGVERVHTTDELFNPLLFGIQPNQLIFDGALIEEDNRTFVLKLRPFFGKTPVIIADYKYDDFTVETFEKKIEPDSTVSLTIDSSIINHLKYFQEEKKFNHWFQILSLEVNIEKIEVQNKPIKPNLIVDVDDYDIQGRVVTLFKEILSPLKFRQTKDRKYRARMLYIRNEIKKFYTRDPLFIVNNRVTRDGDFIAQMPLQEIDNMLIYSNYDSIYKHFGALALGGIVLVEMKDPNYILPVEITLPSFQIQGIQPPIQYPIVQTLRPDSPNVGSLLYWNPNIKVNSTGKFEIEFYTNDMVSDYVIELVAHPKNTGLPSTTLIPITVKPKSAGD